MTAQLLVVAIVVAPWAHHTRRRARVRARVAGREVLPRRVGSPPRLRRALVDADLAVDADVVATAWAAALASCVASISVLGPTGVVLTAVVVAAPAAGLVASAGRRAARARAEAPVLVDAVASAVDAGASLASALDAASLSISGPLHHDVVDVCDEIAHGRPVGEAFGRWADGDDADLRLVARVFSLVARHGGDVGAALERTASTLRRRADLRRERTALATQAKASAAVMIAAPVAFALVAGIADPRTIRFLTSTPVGLTCLVAGIALDALGARWMASIVARAA